MSPEAQTLAIAEAQGWTWWKFKAKDGSEFIQLVELNVKWPSSAHFNGIKCERPESPDCSAAPDYDDLNVIQELSMSLKKDRLLYAQYHKELERIVAIGNSIDDAHWWMTADATAAQRRESYLRVKGLWQDQPQPKE